MVCGAPSVASDMGPEMQMSPADNLATMAKVCV